MIFTSVTFVQLTRRMPSAPAARRSLTLRTLFSQPRLFGLFKGQNAIVNSLSGLDSPKTIFEGGSFAFSGLSVYQLCESLPLAGSQHSFFDFKIQGKNKDKIAENSSANCTTTTASTTCQPTRFDIMIYVNTETFGFIGYKSYYDPIFRR